MQPKMALVFRLVNRLAEGAQQHGLNDGRVFSSRGILQQALVIVRGRFCTAAQVQGQLAQKFPHIGEALRAGTLVHPKQHRVAGRFQEFSGSHVGCQHALFDQFVRIIALHGNYRLNLASVIKDNAGFHGFKIDGAPALPGPAQTEVQAVQVHDVGVALWVHGWIMTVLQHPCYLGVGQTGMGVDNRLVKNTLPDLSGAINHHLAHHGKAIYRGLE